MRLAKIISILGMLAMTAVLIYGFTIGDFISEGSQLTSMPWGIVSLVDLYTAKNPCPSPSCGQSPR
jgi:hypothetical protein